MPFFELTSVIKCDKIDSLINFGRIFMNIKIIKDVKTIMSNPTGVHNYFAWPTVARLQDGTLACVASGFRVGHVCPFGKAVMIRSYDNGESWTRPEVIIDTPLDDRDSGICTFGESGVIVTSFNNTVKFQRGHHDITPYKSAYLDVVEKRCDEEKYLGSTAVISRDCGRTFGDIIMLPVSAPHGPITLNDGSIFYVGRICKGDYSAFEEKVIRCYKISPEGDAELLSKIDDIDGYNSWEPHAIQLPDGKIIVHIRVQDEMTVKAFTTYQCESYDGGKSFTKPHAILPIKGGAPSHLMLHSSGMLISTYSYRMSPYGIRAMFSRDGGESWDSGNQIFVNGMSKTPDGIPIIADPQHADDFDPLNIGADYDLGYPASVELDDGSILTVFYAHEKSGPRSASPAVIRQIVWRFEE